MLFHIFKYRLKCMLKDRTMMFWILLFPVILGTFFNLAFSNLTAGENFQTISIAIIDSDEYQQNENLKGIINSVATTQGNEKAMFDIHVVSSEKAHKLLEEDEVSGVVEISSQIDLTFRRSGINQTIIKEFFDRISQNNILAEDIIHNSDDPQNTANLITQFFITEKNYFHTGEQTSTYPDYTLIYFYSLIGMACFYGSFVGIKEVDAIQANLSNQAIRVNVAPTKKILTFITSVAGATLIQLASIFLLLSYLAFIVNINFGSQLFYIILLCIVGCLCGVSFGAMIGALLKSSEGVKTGILTGTTMFMSFLSGMMQSDVKYMVAKNIPILGYLNPVNAITDGLYALYFYTTYTKYFTNLFILIGFTVLFGFVTILRLRRLKYASI